MGSETIESNSLSSYKNDEEVKLSLGLSNLHEADSPSGRARLNEHEKNEQDHDSRPNFYDEVDQQMSQNSLEYPMLQQQQSNYVDGWLKSVPTPPVANGSQDYCPSVCGNVIGIRGVSRPGGAAHIKEARKRHSPNYKKLEFDYLKLKSQYSELKGNIHGNILRFYKSHARKNDEEDLFVEKGEEKNRSSSADSNLIIDYNSLLNKQIRTICASYEQELKELREQVKKLQCGRGKTGDENEATLLEKLTLENERLRARLDHIGLEREKEVSSLKEQMNKLTLETNGNRTLIKLRDENNRLMDLRELDGTELEALKEKYIRLESQLTGLLEEQKQIQDEKNKQVSELMVELCRFQVHLPKVELLLETERAIKEELQRKLGSVEGENRELRDELARQSAHGGQERMRAARQQVAELESVRQELEDWKDKCSRLTREKADADDLLRGARINSSILDARHQSRLEEADTRHRTELDEWRKNVVSLEQQVSELKARNLQLTGRLQDNELDRERLGSELSGLGVKLDALRSVETRAREQEKLAESLRLQLHELAIEARESGQRLRETEMDLDRHKEQIEELRRRHEHQLRAFEELRKRKDKETSELRVRLNLERYNKQVAMESIENELRVSLKELELMKYRFSRRLHHQNADRPATGHQQPVGCPRKPPPPPPARDDNKQEPGAGSGGDSDAAAARLISAPVRDSTAKVAETSQ